MAKEPNYIVPKDSLRKLTKFEQLAKSKALDSAQHGQTPMHRELVALEYELSRDDTPGVQSYVSQMINVIREHEGSLSDLLLAVPLLKEVATVARINDFSLSQKEKVRVERASVRLQAFVQKYTTLKARTMASLQTRVMNVARAKRESVAESMTNSASALFRLAGRAITPKNRPTTDYEKSVKETRAEVYSNTLERRNVAMREANAGGGRDGFDFGGLDDFGASSGRKSRRVPKDDGGFGGFGAPNVGGSASTTLFQGMLTELQAIRNLLRAQVEDDVRDEEADYRNADNITGSTGSPQQIKENTKKNSPSLIGNLMNAAGAAASAAASGAIGGLAGAASGAAAAAARTVASAGRRAVGAATKVVTSVVKNPAAKRVLGILGPVGAVIGAGWTGWEIGKQIDKYTNMSGRLGDALASVSGVKSDSQHVQEMAAERTSASQSGNMTPSMSAAEGTGTMPGSEVPLSPPPVRAQGPGPAAATPAPQGRGPAPVRVRGKFAVSDSGMNFIMRKEAFRSKAYKDQAGIWTIGYGTTRIDGMPVREGMTITKDRALELKKEHINRDLRSIEKMVKVPLTQNQVDALASFVYNVGPGGLQNSTILRTLNSGGTITADMFTRWNKVKDEKTGKLVESRGLTTRRKEEFAMFSDSSSSVANADLSPQPLALTPSSVRTAAPVSAAAAATAGQGTTVIAPTTVVQSTSAAAPATIVPMPMRTENAEATLRALRAASLI